MISDKLIAAVSDITTNLTLCYNNGLAVCSMKEKVYLYGAPIIMGIAVLGNSMSLAVMMREKLRRTMTAIFLAALAVLDTLAILLGLLRHFLVSYTEVKYIITHNSICLYQDQQTYLSVKIFGAYSVKEQLGGFSSLHTGLPTALYMYLEPGCSDCNVPYIYEYSCPDPHVVPHGNSTVWMSYSHSGQFSAMVFHSKTCMMFALKGCELFEVPKLRSDLK